MPVTKTIVITSGTTWTVPFDFTSNNTIEAWGGGGGGGANAVSARAGGGGAAYTRITGFIATPGNTVPVTIGAGGAANTNGSATTFANTLYNKRLSSIGGNSGNNTGGAGGSSITSVGDTKYAGGAGANSAGSQNKGGGGGGGAGGAFGAGATASVGTDFVGGTGGAGGPTNLASSSVRYVKWIVTSTKTFGNLMQASEFVLQNSGVDISMTGTTVTATQPNQPTEDPSNLVDNNTATKYCSTTTTGPWEFTFDLGSAKTFTGYRWATANDVEGRDPFAWAVQISSDNLNWITVSSVSQTVTSSRNTYTASYTISTQADGAGGLGVNSSNGGPGGRGTLYTIDGLTYGAGGGGAGSGPWTSDDNGTYYNHGGAGGLFGGGGGGGNFLNSTVQRGGNGGIIISYSVNESVGSHVSTFSHFGFN